MNRIDDLIAEVCPNGVEYKAMGDVGSFTRGRRFTKDDVVADGIGSMHYGEIYTRYGVSARTALTHVRSDLAPSLRFARTGDVIIAAVGETVEEVCKAVAWLGQDEIAIHDDCFAYRHSMNPTFVAYYMRTKAFNAEKAKYVARAKMKRISAESLAKLSIPVPPPEVQARIVAILTRMEELEAELEAELQARRHQYEYYRGALLAPTRSGAANWTTLNDAFVMRAGQHVRARDIGHKHDQTHPYPCYGGNGIRGFVRSNSHDGAHLLIGRQGALCGNVRRARGKFYATEHAVVVTPRADVDVDWAFHVLTFMNLNQYATKSAQPGLAVGRLGRVPIAIPPISEQRRIGSLLDKFDALVSDLSVGLPAELSARRQQYEHYRDRLLTFDEAV